MSHAAELALDVTLAEFAALRSEIASRSSAQNSLMNISAVASVGLTGYALQAGPRGAPLIMLLPFVGGLLGLLWVDHHRTIARIGAYIRTHTRSEVLSALSLLEQPSPKVSSLLMRWEWESGHAFAASRRQAIRGYITPQLLLFFLPGVLGILFGIRIAIAAFIASGDLWVLTWQSVLLVVGIALLTNLARTWFDAFASPTVVEVGATREQESAFLEENGIAVDRAAPDAPA